jgi:hypothetical protein
MEKQNTMKMKTFLTMILFAAIITSCKKDKDIDTYSTSYKISQSEMLIIPGVIDLPANAPAGNSRVATWYAEGVQKYKSQAKAGSPGVFEWVFVAPLADLYDVSGKKIGTHAAGPHWTLSPADSIFAQHFAPAKIAPSPDANSIDWLLLQTKVGKVPTGFFKDVAYIQRIATVGGKAPATAPQADGLTVDVPYTAIYRFTKKN